MRKIFRNNGLSITMFGLCFLFIIGQSIVGFKEANSDREDHHRPQITFPAYLGSGHFAEAIFENWESEFLQMGAYVMLTAFLFQKGSSESKDPNNPQSEADKTKEYEAARKHPLAPRPVHKGGLSLKIYEHSLSLSLFTLFALSFIGHGFGGAKEYNEEQKEHGHAPVSTLQFMGSSQFWFQSLQNWQSEFLAVGALSVLSIWFREKDSPESKPVTARDDETGAS